MHICHILRGSSCLSAVPTCSPFLYTKHKCVMCLVFLIWTWAFKWVTDCFCVHWWFASCSTNMFSRLYSFHLSVVLWILVRKVSLMWSVCSSPNDPSVKSSPCSSDVSHHNSFIFITETRFFHTDTFSIIHHTLMMFCLCSFSLASGGLVDLKLEVSSCGQGPSRTAVMPQLSQCHRLQVQASGLQRCFSQRGIWTNSLGAACCKVSVLRCMKSRDVLVLNFILCYYHNIHWT